MSQELKAARMSFVPQACRQVAQHVTCKGGEAEAWIWTSNERANAVVFLGKSAKPYKGHWFYFRRPEAREAFVKSAFECARAAAERKQTEAARKAAARAAGHALKVGDVLESSWGYDQTNIDYYQVTKLVGTQSVEIRQIRKQSAEDGFMTGKCVPAVGHFIGETTRRRVSDYGKRNSVKINSCANAYKIEPQEIAPGVKVFKPSTWSSYA